MAVCIIPARGGSKRIPRKNVALFHGIPMIAWSIRAAQDSELFDRIIVSSDDDEIIDVASEYGAEAPFRRPTELADDFTGTVPVVAHAVDAMDLGDEEVVCCLYPTAPFVRPEDLRRADILLGDQRASDYALSVTSFPFPIQRSLRIASDGRAEPIFPEHEKTRSQDLEEAWHDAGQFYFGRARAWSQQTPIFGSKPLPVPLPRYRVQDIDTPEDWTRAELMFTLLSSDHA